MRFAFLFFAGLVSAQVIPIPIDESMSVAYLRVDAFDVNGKPLKPDSVRLFTKDGKQSFEPPFVLTAGTYRLTIEFDGDRRAREVTLKAGPNRETFVFAPEDYIFVDNQPSPNPIELRFSDPAAAKCTSVLVKPLIGDAESEGVYTILKGRAALDPLWPGAYSATLFDENGVCGIGYFQVKFFAKEAEVKFGVQPRP